MRDSKPIVVNISRALWAREEFIRNPSNSQIDDDMLVWCFNQDDGLWYSIAGNFSCKSPEEKRAYEEEWHKSANAAAFEYYSTVLYQSNIRAQVLERDNHTCQLCFKKGETRLHIHHILKRKEGGSGCLDNLITVCPSCHKSADSKLMYNPIWQ